MLHREGKLLSRLCGLILLVWLVLQPAAPAHAANFAAPRPAAGCAPALSAAEGCSPGLGALGDPAPDRLLQGQRVPLRQSVARRPARRSLRAGSGMGPALLFSSPEPCLNGSTGSVLRTGCPARPRARSLSASPRAPPTAR